MRVFSTERRWSSGGREEGKAWRSWDKLMWEVVRRSQNAPWPWAEDRYSRIFFSFCSAVYSAKRRNKGFVGG
jgi:hypothetical protein